MRHASPARLELRLLGAPELRWKGRSFPPPSPKNLALLCYLAMAREARTRRELAELFWSADRLESVRVALHALRQLPGADAWLLTEGQLVRVEADTDVDRFEAALHEGRFQEAATCSADTLLLGVELRGSDPFMNWLETERARLEGLRRDASHGRLRELEESERWEEALRLVARLLDLDPLDEVACRAGMRLEHARGDIEAARALFERFRLALRAELDAEPSSETLALLRAIERGGTPGGKSAARALRPEDLPLPECLMGRAALAAEIEARLGPGRRVLLHGFGGAGKTALAATLAARHVASGGVTLWLHAGHDDADSLFDALARPLGAHAEVARATPPERPRVLQRLLRDEGVTLVVLDDAWNTYALARLREALPEELALLVTARQRYPEVERFRVGRLERTAAVELLTYHAGRELDPDADTLCALLGDHAFAVRIAGVMLRVDALAPGALLERIRSAPHELALTEPDAGDGPGSVGGLLRASLDVLPDPAYEAFLGFGALFAPIATPELLARCLRRSEEEIEDALMALTYRALAERHAEPGSDAVAFRLHDLAFSFARTRTHLRRRSAMHACRSLLESIAGDFDAVGTDLTNLLGAAEAGREHDDPEALIEIMRRLTVGEAYFGARGYTPRSLELLQAAARAALGAERLEDAHHLVTKLGNAHREILGDPERALEAYEQACDLARRLGSGHREAICLSLVGVARFELGHDDADASLEEGYRLAKRSGNGLALSHVLQNLSYVAGLRKDFATARRLCHESIEVLRRLQVEPAPLQAEVRHKLFFSLFNLGVAEGRLENREEAASALRQALSLAEGHDNQLWRAYALQELGELELGLGERQRAAAYLRQALELYRQNHAQADVRSLTDVMKRSGLLREGQGQGSSR